MTLLLPCLSGSQTPDSLNQPHKVQALQVLRAAHQQGQPNLPNFPAQPLNLHLKSLSPLPEGLAKSSADDSQPLKSAQSNERPVLATVSQPKPDLQQCSPRAELPYIMKGGASVPAGAREAAKLAHATGSYAADDETDPRSMNSAALKSAIHVRQQCLAGALM